MLRKTIAIMLAGDDAELQGNVITGVREQARREHVNVLVFQSLMSCPYIGSTAMISDAVYEGESRIYGLPDYEKLDGIIALGESFLNEKVLDSILAEAGKYRIPVIQIDGQAEGTKSILFDDSMGMELMVRHVVERHGAKTINFISGFRGNRQSEERVRAYRNVLKEFGIPVEEKRIGYGEFGNRTVSVLNEYFEANDDIPDAIICANDMMALQTINYMTRKGYKVPKDLIVTGFDGLPEGQHYSPALTSVRRSIREAGSEAVRIFRKLWSGKEQEDITYLGVELIENQSCGCVPVNFLSAQNLYEYKDRQISLRDGFNAMISEMTRDFTGLATLEEVISVIRKYASFFHMDMHIALNEDLIGSTDGKAVNGYSEKQLVYSLSSDRLFDGESYDVDSLTERLDVMSEGNAEVFFYPLYSQEHTLGYMVGTGVDYELPMPLFHTWIITLTNALGNWYLRKEHERMLEHLDHMYVMDALTGLYNRFGLQRFGEELLRKAEEENGRVMLLSLDMNRLKYINDVHGHASGDRALIRVGDSIRKVAGKDSVCCRIGGDEFVVVKACEGRNDGKLLAAALNEELEHYNLRSGLPYDVTVSCGVVTEKGKGITGLESMMNQADKLMYADKAKNHGMA